MLGVCSQETDVEDKLCRVAADCYASTVSQWIIIITIVVIMNAMTYAVMWYHVVVSSCRLVSL